jgi:3-methyladenine DNA glycosylase AlkD
VATGQITAATLRRKLRAQASATDAVHLQRFFKTGPGQYGEGDRFLGVRVPAVRAIVRAHREATLNVMCALLRSRWHEDRLLALLLMVQQHQRGSPAQQQAVFEAYLGHLPYVNNWDLVDSSAEYIVGPHVSVHDLALLLRLARSVSLWERRTAMLATFHHIKHGDFGPAVQIATILCHDSHDLMHKAVGWMLREIGKRDRGVEVAFLDAHWHTMPRTAVRYAIEHFSPAARRRYTH